ncbi:MAG: hypothetical protein MJ237_09720 [bacterium]|nr:hypothetical protein [bacterium]
MKKILYLVLPILFLMCFSSCDKNDAKEPQYKYDLFDEPCLNWGESQSLVCNWMIEHGFQVKENTEGIITYQANKQAKEMIQRFDDGLSITFVYINSKVTSETDIKGYLSERYVFIKDEEDAKKYTTTDNKTTIIFYESIEDGVYTIVYQKR